jgi:hypothetical protein
MTTYPEPNCSQVAVYQTPTGPPTWLGSLAHVTGLVYSFVYPGGPDKMSCVLEVPAAFRHQILNIGATVRIFRGGHEIWEGILDEPVPTTAGRQLTAVGVGNLAQDYLAVYTDAWPTSEPDEVINNAISRGLPWVNPGVGSPSGIFLGQAQDSASRYVSDILNLLTSRGGLSWYVNAQPGGTMGNALTVAALPTTVTRLLLVTSPVARTSGGDVKAIYVRYQVSADSSDSTTAAVYATTSVVNTGHGGREYYLDLSNAGTMSAGTAQGVASKVLQIYQRASFAGPFDVAPGYLLTTGGVPVDPGTEQAGGVWKPIFADDAYGGEVSAQVPVQFIVGGYVWDDQKRTGSVTPFQTLDTSLSAVMAQQQTLVTPVQAA